MKKTNNIDFDIIRKHCKSEAVKTFMGIDAKAILKDIITTIEDGGDSLKTIIEKREKRHSAKIWISYS